MEAFLDQKKFPDIGMELNERGNVQISFASDPTLLIEVGFPNIVCIRWEVDPNSPKEIRLKKAS